MSVTYEEGDTVYFNRTGPASGEVVSVDGDGVEVEVEVMTIGVGSQRLILRRDEMLGFSPRRARMVAAS